MNTQALDMATCAPTALRWNPRTLAGGLLAAAALAIYLAAELGWRQAALFLVGIGAGVCLYHAAFGFTAAWRRFLKSRRGAGLRAQMVMIGVAAAVFLPLLALGQLGDTPLRGSVSPLGLGVVGGAFIFGIGMQLGGGCASGTLFTVGGGSVRMVVTLAAFIAGSVLGALHLPGWEALPTLGRASLLESFGLGGAMALTLGALALVYWGSRHIEQRAHGNVQRRDSAGSPYGWLRGPWPLVAGALGLAAVNIATLMLAGRPWGVTSAFALWGSKMAASLGIDVSTWPYWQAADRAASLQASVLHDITSVMNFGIVLGALVAAGLAGRFAPTWRVPLRSLAAAIIGGLMLGYGARIAYGCNIGAYFSGIASSSLHGWIWFVAALAGNGLGLRLRPWFRLD
jgi:uncharacterized membrane protein YedE/YeeE